MLYFNAGITWMQACKGGSDMGDFDKKINAVAGGDPKANATAQLFKAVIMAVRHLPELIRFIKEISAELNLNNMPNIPTRTGGGKVFWITLEDINGLRLQQNHLTKHYRIIGPPPDHTRLAWGTKAGMEQLLGELQKRTGGLSGIS